MSYTNNPNRIDYPNVIHGTRSRALEGCRCPKCMTQLEVIRTRKEVAAMERGRELCKCTDHSADPNTCAHLRVRFGMTLTDYNKRLARQGGVCAICTRSQDEAHMLDRRMHVDHDHQTGAVRGILCIRCNTRLGAVERGTRAPSSADTAYLTRAALERAA